MALLDKSCFIAFNNSLALNSSNSGESLPLYFAFILPSFYLSYDFQMNLLCHKKLFNFSVLVKLVK